MHAHALHVRPTTRLGRWAIAVALGYVVFMPLWMFLPGGAALAFLCGLAGGALAIEACSPTRRSSRSCSWSRSCWRSCCSATTDRG